MKKYHENRTQLMIVIAKSFLYDDEPKDGSNIDMIDRIPRITCAKLRKGQRTVLSPRRIPSGFRAPLGQDNEAVLEGN